MPSATRTAPFTSVVASKGGELRGGQKWGYGKFVWPNGDEYEGNWSEDRMSGYGRFLHREGKELNGVFKHNYFYYGGNIALDPFQPLAELNYFVDRQGDILRLKEEAKVKDLRSVEVVSSRQPLLDLIDRSVGVQKLVPLIAPSKESVTVHA